MQTIGTITRKRFSDQDLIEPYSRITAAQLTGPSGEPRITSYFSSNIGRPRAATSI